MKRSRRRRGADARAHPSSGTLERRIRDDVGQGLVEFLMVMPLLVLLVFGIIEMGAAWRSYQVITNTAREGARVAVLPGSDVNEERVREVIDDRLAGGGLDPSKATVEIHCETAGGGTAEGAGCFGPDRMGNGTEVRIAYPHTFILLAPITRYMGGDGAAFGTVTMQTGIVMRNE